MTLIKQSPALVIIVLASIFFVNCTTTISRPKDPVFSVDVKVVQGELNKTVTYEHINLSGAEIKTDGKISSQLKISITNGKSIPADDVQLKALGKSIASSIKSLLKDPNEYNKYTVLFVTESADAGVTKRHWKSIDFKSDEL